MEDKTDKQDFLSRLQVLCLQYEAFQHIAKNSREPERWSVFLNDYRKANSARVAKQFDELNAYLQTLSQESEVWKTLTALVEGLLT